MTLPDEIPRSVTQAGLAAYTRNRDDLNVHPDDRHRRMAAALRAMLEALNPTPSRVVRRAHP